MKRKKQTEEEARYGSSNPKKSDLKKLLHPPASKKKRHDDRSMDDSSAGYITSWGDIRSYPVKSIVGKYASLPRKTNKEKTGAGTSAWTTDTMSNREDLIQQAKEIRKRRRRSKSESNIRNVFLTKGYCQLRLHVPNADRLGNQIGYQSSLKDRQNATAAMFSETIQNEPHRSDDTIDHGLLAADEFVGEFNGVLKQQPNCRSSAIGVDFF
uniref:Uncharacterized protein n=1 Tax=Ciona savignyi TaxID=51511 RepID=H2ZPG4_CIOSA